jgi:hypothetical protein
MMMMMMMMMMHDDTYNFPPPPSFLFLIFSSTDLFSRFILPLLLNVNIKWPTKHASDGRATPTDNNAKEETMQYNKKLMPT